MGIQKIVLHKNREVQPLVGEDSWDDSDYGEIVECGCELGMVDGNMCSIPYELYDLPHLRDVLSLDTWNLCLTEEERFNLSAHLPDMDQQTFCLTMKELFDGSDLYFGNPLDMFFERLKAGCYPPSVTICRESFLFLKRRKFYHLLKSYHDRMVHKFVDMKRMWDQIEVSSSVEERIAWWMKRRKLEGMNMLDLNKSPQEENATSYEVNLDMKRSKSVARVRSKSILPSQNTKGAKIGTPSSGAKGVLKRKGSILLQSHVKKFDAGIKSEQFSSVPKGVLKIVPKLFSARAEQSEVLTTGALLNFPVRTQGLQDCQSASLPVSLRNHRNSIALPESSFKLNDGRVCLAMDQRPFILNEQGSVGRTTNHIESASGKTIKQTVPLPHLEKQKLHGRDTRMGSNKNYDSTMNPTGLGRCYFGSENLRPNFSGATTKDIPLKYIESYPFGNQFLEGKPQLAITREEHVTLGPRTQEVVSRITNVSNCFLETLASSSLDRIKASSEVSSMESGKLLSESASDKVNNASRLPLTFTYKRRKAHAKVNSVGVLNSVTLKEQHQPLREGAQALKLNVPG